MLHNDMYQEALLEAQAVHLRANFLLSHDKFIANKVDEVALIFSDEKDLMDFCTWGVKSMGMDHFNSVRDTMKRQDRNETFDVAFEFLKFPTHDWRIEAMAVISGTAPLHASHLQFQGPGTVVHASWRCSGADAYNSDKRVLLKSAESDGKVMAAEYTNSYGIFSYFPCGRYYLKPRINLRDPIS